LRSRVVFLCFSVVVLLQQVVIARLPQSLKIQDLLLSQTRSKGRHGYGSQFQLIFPPYIIGMACFPKWWLEVEANKQTVENYKMKAAAMGVSDYK
jgi:hypothetical protein